MDGDKFPRYRILANDKERVGRWVCDRLGIKYGNDNCQAIGHELDGELIAGVLYDNWNHASIAMHVAATNKRWLTREYLRVLFDYPFRQLGVRKVVAGVDESNVVSCKFVEHIGFILETRLKDAAKGGDLLLFSMTKDQCRWI